MTTDRDTSEADRLKQTILEGVPRLGLTSRFKFRCHSGLDCFNCCCADVNIVLTPYDVLRMRRRLGLGSEEFLTRYTVMPTLKDQKIPVVLLKMQDNEKKSCHFVGEAGCTIYEDRPWPCRMYPVGMASSSTRHHEGEEFYFLVEEDHCHGHGKEREWTVAEWMQDQGVAAYNGHGQLYKDITLHPRLVSGPPLDQRQLEMFFMACYDLDRFRRFIFESSFAERFELAQETATELRSDDEALLCFGLEWLRFVLFGERTMKVKPLALEKARQSLQNQRE